MDAAKLACSPGALDLKSCCADFTVVSFYKIFGYPTGLGALLVRHDAAPLLQPAEATYFAGVAEKVGVEVSGPQYPGWLTVLRCQDDQIMIKSPLNPSLQGGFK